MGDLASALPLKSLGFREIAAEESDSQPRLRQRYAGAPMMTRSRLLFVTLALLTAAACTRLPRDFDALPPDRKVAVYVAYLKDGGVPRNNARGSIAADGRAAADAIATALGGSLDVENKTELVMILQQMHSGGVKLKGTRAYNALRHLQIEPASSPHLREMATGTIRLIETR